MTQLKSDRLTFTIAAMLVLAIIVYARRYVDPLDPISWTYQVLALCLLLVAIAGRALIGGTPGQEGDRQWSSALIMPALVIAAALPYLPALRVGFLSDDFGLVYAVEKVNGPLAAMQDPAYRGLYRPLSLLVWWLGVQLWAGSPVGYHLLSIALHCANTLLLYALGRRWIGNVYGAALGATLFAVHPLHVEAVVWLCSHSDLLYTTFGLASLIALEHHLAAQGWRRHAWLAGGFFAFLLALLGKEAAVALPGVVILRLVLLPPRPSRSRFITIIAVYVIALIPYTAAYLKAVGRSGGYQLPLTFWNTWFPSAPLAMMSDFFFPINRLQFSELNPLFWLGALIVMAIVLLWLIRGLDHVPASRLWFYLGFVFAMAIPVWIYSAGSSGILEATRRAYFPTVTLALLFGEVCAGVRVTIRKRSAALVFLFLVFFAVLTSWYITPWRQGGQLADKVVARAATLVRSINKNQQKPTLYVAALPDMSYGVPIFRNCFPQALLRAVRDSFPIYAVTDNPGPDNIPPELMDKWVLQSGEYLLAWQPAEDKMVIVRAGGGKQ